MQIKAIIFVFMVLLLAFLPNTSNGAVGLSFRMSIGYAQPVNITDTEGAVAVFNGTVSAEWSESCTVTFELNVSENWSATVEPAKIHLTAPSDSENFSLKVVVPPKAKVGTFRVNVVATFTGDLSGDSSSATVSTSASVNQYYKGKIDIEEKEKTVKSGEKAIFNVNITNLGNGEDTFKIEFREEKYEKEKWGLKSTPITLKPDETKNITIEIQTPSEYEGTQEFEIILISERKAKTENKTGEVGNIKLIVKVEKSKTPIETILDIIRKYIIPIAGIIVLLFVLIVVMVVRRRKKKKEKIQFISEQQKQEEKSSE